MRLPVFLLLFLSFSAAAQNNIADAYLVRNGGDTARGRILLPRGFDFGNDKSFREVIWITGDSTQDVYDISEVLAFGLRKRRLEAHYRRLKLPGERRPYFAKVLQPGKRFSLYYGNYETSVIGGGSLMQAPGRSYPVPTPSFQSVTVDLLILEDRNGKVLVLSRDGWNTSRKKLLQFLKEDRSAQLLAGSTVREFVDLFDFVKAADAL
jgi:hypothetical protein